MTDGATTAEEARKRAATPDYPNMTYTLIGYVRRNSMNAG